MLINKSMFLFINPGRLLVPFKFTNNIITPYVFYIRLVFVFYCNVKNSVLQKFLKEGDIASRIRPNSIIDKINYWGILHTLTLRNLVFFSMALHSPTPYY